MLYLKSVLMGIVEGLTEFLPISSTGHLIIFDRFLNFADEDFGRMYEVVIQLGAILAVVVYFHRKLIPAEALHDAVTRRRTFLIWLKSAVGVLPALVVGGTAYYLGLCNRRLLQPFELKQPEGAVTEKTGEK